MNLPRPRFHLAAQIDATGHCLCDFARHHGIPFKFHSVLVAKWETVRGEGHGTGLPRGHALCSSVAPSQVPFAHFFTWSNPKFSFFKWKISNDKISFLYR